MKRNSNTIMFLNFIFVKGLDLALLSLSNHSILTYGTFSMWGALFSQSNNANSGEVLMPQNYAFTDIGSRINMTNIPRWKFL